MGIPYLRLITFALFWTIISTQQDSSLQQQLTATAEIYHDSGWVMKGEETTFFCLVSNTRDEYIVKFSHNNVTLSENTKIIGNDDYDFKYNVVRVDGSSFVRFYLTVSDTVRANSGRYGCHILSSAEQDSSTVLSSSYASLSVFYLPAKLYPTCAGWVHPPQDSTRQSLTLVEGDEVTLTCMSESGQPSVSLRWLGLGTAASSSLSVDDGVMTHTLTAQPQDGDILICQMELNEAVFVDETNRECSIGPFNVLPKPVVTMEPVVIVKTIGSNAHFRCNVEGVDERLKKFRREWSTYPNIPEDRLFISVDKTTILIQHVSLADNKTVVSCKAVTNLVSVEASGMLKIIGHQEDSTDHSPAAALDMETTTEPPLPSTQDIIYSTDGGNYDDHVTRSAVASPDPAISSTYLSSTERNEDPIANDQWRSGNPSKTPQDLVEGPDSPSETVGNHSKLVMQSCQADMNSYAPFITAIIVTSLVSVLAIIADILLVVKLFQRKNATPL